MYLLRTVFAAAAAVSFATSPTSAYDFGRAAKPEEIKVWDIDVRPDGKGLPDGSGTVAQGKVVFEQNCAACHGANGQNGIKDQLAGGQGSLASDKPIKTVGSFWPYATTLFDYIHRAMPYQAPGSLEVNDTYAVAAYVLSLNGILAADGKLDKQCVSAWNKDPVFGVIGIQSGPRDKGPQWLPSSHGSRGWDAGGGDDW